MGDKEVTIILMIVLLVLAYLFPPLGKTLTNFVFKVLGPVLPHLYNAYDIIIQYVTLVNIGFVVALYVLWNVVKYFKRDLVHQSQRLDPNRCGACGNNLGLERCELCGRKYCPQHIHPDNHKCERKKEEGWFVK